MNVVISSVSNLRSTCLLFFFLLGALICVSGCAPKTGQSAGLWPVQDADLSRIEDGTFRGEYRSESLTESVDVTVIDHRIMAIEIVKPADRLYSKKCAFCNAEDMIQLILQSQSLQIDAVSGASITTAAVVKATENALQNAAESQPCR